MIVILMGVTGTGKTTVGCALADAMGWEFADADDFHSAANREKMHAGIPLSDADREPWLRSLHEKIMEWAGAGKNAILACSALKDSYRAILMGEAPPSAFRFIYLTGPVTVIRQRLEARQGHFMSPSLLPSQLATLDPPHDAIEISVVPPVPELVREIRGILIEVHSTGAGDSSEQPK